MKQYPLVEHDGHCNKRLRPNSTTEDIFTYPVPEINDKICGAVGLFLTPDKYVLRLGGCAEIEGRQYTNWFGPFRQYLVNPSWQAAQSLKKLGLGQDVVIYAKELPVSYTAVQKIIADIWETIKPKMAVHMGIAPGSKAVTLEQCGKNQGYKQRDVCGACPPGHCCMEEGPDTLFSIIDMKPLVKHLKSMGLDVIYSRDAGRYLCEYAYYYSLYVSQRKAVFLHLPTCGILADMGKLVPMLQAIIQAMLCQLEGPHVVPQHHGQAAH